MNTAIRHAFKLLRSEAARVDAGLLDDFQVSADEDCAAREGCVPRDRSGANAVPAVDCSEGVAAKTRRKAGDRRPLAEPPPALTAPSPVSSSR